MLDPAEKSALEHAASLLNDPADQREQEAKRIIHDVIGATTARQQGPPQTRNVIAQGANAGGPPPGPGY